MTAPRSFTSWLAPHFDRFVALKHASGKIYASQRNLLLAFDRYVDLQAPKPPLERGTLIQYLASLERLSPRGRDNVVGVLWPAVAYALRHDGDIEALPARPPTPWSYWRQRPPRILCATEAKSLLVAAGELTPGSLRPARTATLIGLLYTTGLRIGEALALDVGDLDWRDQLLTVKKGKFGKKRVLPLRDSTMEALDRYVEDPLRPVGTGVLAPLFVSARRRRLSYPTFSTDLHEASLSAGLAKPWPRPHDFRHTFAVSRVTQWYKQVSDVNDMLPALSTYLGHISVEHTRKYLIANGALLEQACVRFADQASALDEVLS